jgi:hypothetical protein
VQFLCYSKIVRCIIFSCFEIFIYIFGLLWVFKNLNLVVSETLGCVWEITWTASTWDKAEAIRKLESWWNEMLIHSANWKQRSLAQMRRNSACSHKSFGQKDRPGSKARVPKATSICGHWWSLLLSVCSWVIWGEALFSCTVQRSKAGLRHTVYLSAYRGLTHLLSLVTGAGSAILCWSDYLPNHVGTKLNLLGTYSLCSFPQTYLGLPISDSKLPWWALYPLLQTDGRCSQSHILACLKPENTKHLPPFKVHSQTKC